MTAALRIVSVCRSLPTPDDPSGGVFVFNRLQAMRAQARLRIVQPLPYLPIIRPLPVWAAARTRPLNGAVITHAPMPYIPGVLKSADSLWLARAIAPVLERMHRDDPIDAIDAHFGYPEGAGCVRVARRLGIPVFITIRGFENEYVHKPGIGNQLINALRAATGCVSVSHALRDLAVENDVDPQRVRVVHNAIDSRIFRRGDREQARAAIGHPVADRLIVSVGHLVSRKRHHVLLDAFARVLRVHASSQLVIIGARAFERHYPDQLQARARALGIAQRVRFAGNLPPGEVVRWLQAADVFALATAREGCCNAVLEALAVGLPVVTTSVGDNGYFVKDGVNGYIVPVDAAQTLAGAIERTLARTDWDSEEISRQLVAQAGDWSDVATRVLDFMREKLSDTSAETARTVGERTPRTEP